MIIKNIAILVIILPLFSSIITVDFFNRFKKNYYNFISCGLMMLATLIAFVIFVYSYKYDIALDIKIRPWIFFGDIKIYWSLFLDRLTSIMILIITLISTVVHFYSLGYMKDDINIQKFLSLLSLFTFFMLLLVCADNFLQLFLGWEGVGLTSYLLIGFWNYKESANSAAIKAFITNRIGDFFFLIGIVIIFHYTNSFEFSKVFESAEYLTTIQTNIFHLNILDIICILLFLGCMGKSAQIGLHTWLADAMEGPTPASALIHAATMVTAGVFLIAKCSFLYEYSKIALGFIAIIGSVTCIFAASIAIMQTDIKKIIAYSTSSQLGYMFLACGLSDYRTGIFHLITHAFFKALLFLSAGNIIYIVHEQNIFKLGNLREELPLTYLNFWVGSLALIGIYPLAGFYSKDLILEAAYRDGSFGKLTFVLGIISILLTAIYCIKIILLVFHGNSKIHNKLDKITEPPMIMNAPLSVLTIGSFFSGMIGFYILRLDKYSGYFSSSIFTLSITPEHKISLFIQLLPMFVGIGGIILGFVLYKTPLASMIKSMLGGFSNLLSNGYYFDEIYNRIFVRNINKLGDISNFIDTKIIDNISTNFTSNITNRMNKGIKSIQTGYISNYIFLTMLGIIIIISYFIINYIKTIQHA